MNLEQARFNMIEQQIKPWKVFDEQLLGAMSSLPRELFLQEEQRGLAYADIGIPLGHKQAMLAPRELARIIQALELSKDDKVLDIGTGSGYSSALLSKLCKQVFSVEIIADFVKRSQKIHKKLAIQNVMIEEGDACDGWMAHAPYDAILVSSALPALSDNFKRNINKQGRVACILEREVGLEAVIATLDEHQDWNYEVLFPINAKKMINADVTNTFVF
jgi:protein-L-isoaspartate(D-aspartate) O-methyltransferase